MSTKEYSYIGISVNLCNKFVCISGLPVLTLSGWNWAWALGFAFVQLGPFCCNKPICNSVVPNCVGAIFESWFVFPFPLLLSPPLGGSGLTAFTMSVI